MESDPLSSLYWQHLEPNVKSLWRIQNLISSLIILALASVPVIVIAVQRSPLFKPLLGALLALAVLLLGIGQWRVGKSFEMFRFCLGEDDLAVTQGIFWRQWKFISRNRVQHIDISAGPIARSLGLVEVSIFVGGMATAAVSIPGLNERRGEHLRKHLIRDRSPEHVPEKSEPTQDIPPVIEPMTIAPPIAQPNAETPREGDSRE